MIFDKNSPLVYLPYVPLARYIDSLQKNKTSGKDRSRAERDWNDARGILLDRIERALNGDKEAWGLLIGLPVLHNNLICFAEAVLSVDPQAGFTADPPFHIQVYCVDTSSVFVVTNISKLVPARQLMPKLDRFK